MSSPLPELIQSQRGIDALTDHPFVSIIVLCRNETEFIGQCLDSLLGGDYPPARMEILVVDGMSEDSTRGIVQRYAQSHPCITLLDNVKQITPSAFNVGIRHARGDVIMPMSAHALYPSNYVSSLVGWLIRSGADNVGGVLITRPANNTPRARAIATGLAHPFGVGNSYFRIGSVAPRWVDTVPFGCYRREVFERVGMFDEELVRNQDDEFNLRLIKRGGRILLVPHVASYYYARASLRQLWRMYYQYGYFKPLVARKVGGVLTLRQLVPALFVSSLVATALLAPWSSGMAALLAAISLTYAAADVACSAAVGRREGARVGLALSAVFPVLHLSYGVGFLKGMLDFLLLARRPSRNAAAVPLSR